MAEVLLSPGIQITETDRSFVPARPLTAGAAIIGPTVKGPANVPVVVTSYGDFQRTFGTTFMMNRYKENYSELVADALVKAEAEMVPYSRSGAGTEEDPYVYEALEKNAEDLYPVNEGQTYYHHIKTKTFNTGSCEYDEKDEYVEFVAPSSGSYGEEIAALPDSDKVWESSMLQQKSQEFLTSMAAKSYFEQGGDSLLVVRVTDNEFESGRAEIKTRNGERVALEIKTISQGEYLNNWVGEPQDRTESTGSITGVIREDGSLVKGNKNNIRWEIADVDIETGTFSIYVRRGDDIDSDKAILEAFTGLNLDPDSENYVARRIGDQHQEFVEEPSDKGPIYYVTVHGNYPNVSKYIYISKVNDIFGYFLADGFTRRGSADDEAHESEKIDIDGECVITSDVAYLLPQTCEGGFQDAKGKLFSTHEDEAKALFFEDITNGHAGGVGGPDKIQGINPVEYEKLIAVLGNQDEYEFNVISVPGLTVANNSTQVDMVNSLASKRGDNIAVVDLVGFRTPIDDTIQKAQGLNSSYSATYWPWLQMYSSTGRLEWVPASVIIPGVYAYSDKVAAPWFAPAGTTRGSVQGVIQAERKLLKQHRDDLYKKNVNPIATLPGGITIYGQKTLQKKSTALDRVNVRRLLIELKRVVRNMAAGILFEQNDAQLRSTFKANLDQYLESVTKRRGLYAYKSVVEEVNTPDVIDRNEFRCQIYIQPTKVIEFIYIDFTITNTGVEFNN
jgi:hypothetical protein